MKKLYYERLNKKLSLKNPKTLNEKIQWLKFYYRKPCHTRLVDKYAVREYVEEKIGGEYLIPLIGVYDSPEQIPFDDLPDRFILKATHGSSMNIICRDKSELDVKAVRQTLATWLNTNFYDQTREWVYREIPPRIVCETLLGTPEGKVPDDYKVFCFNGKPKYIQVDAGRFSNLTCNFYDPQWNLMDFRCTFPPVPYEIPKPEQLDRMLRLAEQLAQKETFNRIDFYCHEGRIYFGEITFFPASGNANWYPEEADLMLGELLTLPEPTR